MLARTSLVAVAAAALAPAAAADTPPATTTLPPDLQALEQQAKQLQINSQHIRLAVDLGGGTFSGPLVSGDILVSRTPAAAEVHLTAPGVKLEERVIGTTLYVNDPAIARRDGGRPWVRVAKRGISELTGIAPNAISNGTPTQDVLTSLLTQLAPQNIKEVGPSTANGQPATEFTGTVDLATAASGIAPKLAKQFQQLVKQLGSVMTTLDLFVAPNGLPTRTILAINAKGIAVTVTEDILAINIPVAVQAPPARKTVAYAKVRKLLHGHL